VPTHFGDDLMTGSVDTVRTIVRDGQIRRLHPPVDADFTDIAITGRDGTPLTIDPCRMLTIATA